MLAVAVVAAAAALWLDLLEVEAEDKIVINKCCGVNEALYREDWSCIPGPWFPYNISTHVVDTLDAVRGPLNESWLRRWVPPGVPLGAIAEVYPGQQPSYMRPGIPMPVRTSGLAERQTGGAWRGDRALFRGHNVIRRSPDGVLREGPYCLDAVVPPYPAPFALKYRHCDSFAPDCVLLCCRFNYILTEAANGALSCAQNFSVWQYSFKRLIEATYPLIPGMSYIADYVHYCPNGKRSIHRLPTPASVRARMNMYTDGFFSSTLSCVSYVFRADGTSEHVAMHCDFFRGSRAFFWCTRPLCFVSALLLLAALVAIVTSARLRSSVHGWALGCHAGCLLAFNLLQIAFYLSGNDHAEFHLTKILHEDSRLHCLAFALPIYFLLTAANCWLTVICFNMSKGFKLTRATHVGGRMRTFVQLSLFAWGIPIVLTATCASLYENNPMEEWKGSPSLVETRTCYVESRISATGDGNKILKSNKAGSALYYYAPMAVLSAVSLICVIKTMRRVRILTRGNSVLRTDVKERKKKDQGQKETTNTQDRIRQEKRGLEGALSGPKSVSVYIRLLLSAGVLELATETVAWASSIYVSNESVGAWEYETEFMTQSFSYRAVGYLTDLARAAIVLWLAAPEAADLRAFFRRLLRSCRLRLFWQRGTHSARGQAAGVLSVRPHVTERR